MLEAKTYLVTTALTGKVPEFLECFGDRHGEDSYKITVYPLTVETIKTCLSQMFEVDATVEECEP